MHPTGWDFGAGGLLIKNDREQQAILLMKGLRAEGKSYQHIADVLDARGIASKCGGRWIHSTVNKVLRRAIRLVADPTVGCGQRTAAATLGSGAETGGAPC